MILFNQNYPLLVSLLSEPSLYFFEYLKSHKLTSEYSFRFQIYSYLKDNYIQRDIPHLFLFILYLACSSNWRSLLLKEGKLFIFLLLHLKRPIVWWKCSIAPSEKQSFLIKESYLSGELVQAMERAHHHFYCLI